MHYHLLVSALSTSFLSHCSPLFSLLSSLLPQNMLGTGACGWMCDFGETLPLDAKLSGGQDPHQYHSLYPEIWAQLNGDAISNASRNSAACSPDDTVFFMRSGNVQSPSVARLFWLGDQTVTWDSHDGLGTVIIGMLTEGLSGYSLTHSDIGGYTAIDHFILRLAWCVCVCVCVCVFYVCCVCMFVCVWCCMCVYCVVLYVYVCGGVWVIWEIR